MDMLVEKIKVYFPGLLLVLGIIVGAGILSGYLHNFIRVEMITISLFLGIAVGNLFKISTTFIPGIQFAMNWLIKGAIVLLGFKLDAGILLEAGGRTFLLVLVFTPFVIIAGYYLGKFMGLGKKLALLIAVGSGICGVAAILALSPSVKAEKEDVIVAASITSFLGTLGIVIFSLLGSLQGFPLDPIAFGIWCGLSLHGVSQAMAAAFSMGSLAGEAGTIVKLTRVLMLVPIAFVFTSMFHEKVSEKVVERERYTRIQAIRTALPVYLLAFIAVVIGNSAGLFPREFSGFMGEASTWLLLMSMTAMGVSLQLKKVAGNGIKALVFGGILFCIVTVLGYNVINYLY